jgi:hypothetical protein
VIVKKDELFITQDPKLIYAFKDLIESNKDYAKFYETDRLSFYAKKDWLKKKGINF